MTIARPALAAMWRPITGTRVVSVRPSRAVRRNSVPTWRSSRISTTQSAAAAASGSEASAGVPTVTVGTSLRATTSAPGSESMQTTARRARSGRNSGSFASKYSRMSA